MNTRDKIHSAINEHIDIEDTYAYFLTREKSSFSVGTVTLDDFEEWTDSDVADLTDSIMEKINPELNENQQIVLDYLKKMCPPKLDVSAMVTVYCLVDDNINDNWQEYSEEIPKHIEALQKLSISEENQVLAAFAEWGMKEVAQ